MPKVSQENPTNLISQMRSKIPVSVAKFPKNMTLAAFAEYWLQYLTPNLKESTRYAYRSAIDNHIKRVFSTMKLSEITSEDVQLFIMSLTEGMDLDDPLSPKTIRNVHGVLHKCFQKAYELNIIDKNPAKHTALPKLKKPELIPMNNEQVGAFLTAIISHPLECFLKLALFTGMRKGELIGLTWDCFSFDKGCIRVYRQLSYDKDKRRYYFDSVKNGKSRTIFPPEAIMEMMQKLYEREPNCPYVFCGTNGNEHLTHSMIRKPFERLMTNLGMPEFRFHDLRHTFAVICIKAGVDLKTLSEAMGHYSVAFTLDTYAFALNDMKKDCAQRMQSFMDKQNISI